MADRRISPYRIVPWTLAAAVLAGVALAIAIVPNRDQHKALWGIASIDPEIRAQSWLWLSVIPPGGHRPRLVVMQGHDPSCLHDPVQAAGGPARRDAAVALIGVDQLDLATIPSATVMMLIEALQAGSPDEQRLAALMEASHLRLRGNDVTMQP